jgi:dethiobiotin synthetase
VNALLMTGTDAQVGKTVVTAALAAYGQTYGYPNSVGVMKPVEVSDHDRTFYTRLLQWDQDPELLTPEYLETELPLPLALEQTGRSLALDHVWRQLQSMMARYSWVLLEGLGSLGTPLTPEMVMADLAWDWRLPTVLVVPVSPGAIAQAVAQVALARQMRVQMRGLVLNCLQPYSPEQVAQWVPLDLLRSLTRVPVLGCVPYLADPTDREALVQAAAGLDLEYLIPQWSSWNWQVS